MWINYAAGQSPQEFGKFLHQGAINESSTQTQVRLFLSKVSFFLIRSCHLQHPNVIETIQTLVQCTAGEAERLARDPVLLPHFNDSVLIILVLLVENANHYECLKSCLTNYLHVVQVSVFVLQTGAICNQTHEKITQGMWGYHAKEDPLTPAHALKAHTLPLASDPFLNLLPLIFIQAITIRIRVEIIKIPM